MVKEFIKIIKDFIQKKRYIYIVFLLIICIIYFCSFNFVFAKKLPTEMIQNISDIDSVILSFFSIIGIVFTLIYAIRQYESEKRHRRISKAADLAKLYADELLSPISIIVNALSALESTEDKKIEFGDMFEKIDLDSICEFNRKEMGHILSDAEIMYYKYNVNKPAAIKNGDEFYSLRSLIGTTLNRIEYFCIYFNSGIAEDMTVYQSLHQTFFLVIKYTYIYISSQNESDMDKYYTNIIKTYIRWREIYTEKRKQIAKEERKLELAQEKCRKNISAKTESPNA